MSILPPISPETSQSNPKFAALYRNLCTNKLNPDGSTHLDINAQKEREAFLEDLRKARVSAAKSALIKSHLAGLVVDREDELPLELRELVAIITASLSAQLSGEESRLLGPDVEMFKENISPITKAISGSIQRDIEALARILSPNSTLTSSSRSLLAEINKTKTAVLAANQTLATARLEIAHETTHLLTLYRAATELSIRILEQTLHGALSRATRTKASYLSVVAEGMSLKLRLQHNALLHSTKSPELEEAIQTRCEELEREGSALKRKVREKREALEEFRRGGGTVGMVGEYARILGECERVVGEIERLEKSSGG